SKAGGEVMNAENVTISQAELGEGVIALRCDAHMKLASGQGITIHDLKLIRTRSSVLELSWPRCFKNHLFRSLVEITGRDASAVEIELLAQMKTTYRELALRRADLRGIHARNR
ncbi:MAG: hypothetical protein NDJ92_18350, partial [Thermoanaerobaculia bacterium]|nr:hypothetical protein [Thermoanaerobaculia bacterium]